MQTSNLVLLFRVSIYLVPKLFVELLVSGCISWSSLKSNGFFLFFLNEDDLSLIRRNRMALFQQLTCVLPILDNLLKANVINKQEHDIIKQKTQIPILPTT